MNITPKQKRKHQFIIIETGQHVYLDRIQNANTYFVCDSPSLSLDDNYFPIDVSLLKEAGKQRTGISSKPKALTEAKKSFKQELNVFYASQLLQIPKYCENCQAPLYIFTKWDGRKMTCHILPKSTFPELAIHQLNRIFMCCDGGCYGHAKYDNGDALERSQMPVYKYVIERWPELKKCLTEAKIVKAEKYLGL